MKPLLAAANEELEVEGEAPETLLAARECDELEGEETKPLLVAADEELELEGKDPEVLIAAGDYDELDGEKPQILLVAPSCAVLLEGKDPKVLLNAADCELELEGMAFEADIDVLLKAASGGLDELGGETGFEETAAEYALLEVAAREENVDDCAAR